MLEKQDQATKRLVASVLSSVGVTILLAIVPIMDAAAIVHGSIVSQEYYLPSTSDPNARCKKSELTQDEFLEMVNAIIKHGDLTDKDFIEKTLQIKFGSIDKALASNHISDGGFYFTNMPSNIKNAPIRVTLDIGALSLNEAGKSELSAGVTFQNLDLVGAVFHNCQFLTKEQLEQKLRFDAKTVKSSLFGNVGSVSQDLGRIGKNGSDISAFYSFRVDDSNAIKEITISQKSEAHLKLTGEDNAKHH